MDVKPSAFFRSKGADVEGDFRNFFGICGAGMLAFNLLRSIGQEAIKRAALAPLKIKVQRWRLKTVLQNIIYCAVRIIRHAGGIQLHLGKCCAWFDVIAYMAGAKT